MFSKKANFEVKSEIRSMSVLQQLRETLSEMRELEKVNRHVDNLQSQLDKDYAELTLLVKRLEKEFKEYEKLENGSLKGIFYKILGNKEKQLEKERQEYLQLSLKHDELNERIKLSEYEMKVLDKKLGRYELLEKKLKQLKRQREQLLLRSDSTDSLKLRKLLKQMDDRVIFIKDIDEASEMGRVVMQQLDQMIHFLKTARNWGNWDMGTKGRAYSYRKHTNIDRAKQTAYRIQHNLRKYEDEIRDVYPEFKGFRFNLDLGKFNTFIDVFFDNLISDWIIQRRIVNSLNDVLSLRDKAKRINSSLNVDRKKTQTEIEELELHKDRIISGEA
jgi:hypothetical protein